MPGATMIRSMLPSDLDALVDIVDRCNEQMSAWAPHGWRPPDPESERPGWLPQGDGGTDLAFVACDDGVAVAGGVLARVDDGSTVAHVRRLFVDPTHQGSGIGAALLATCEEAMRRQGAERATLATPVDSPAIGFYEARGWMAAGRAERHERLGLGMLAYEKTLTR